MSPHRSTLPAGPGHFRSLSDRHRKACWVSRLRHWATGGLCLAALAAPTWTAQGAVFRPGAADGQSAVARSARNPLEARLLADLADERLDEFTLWEAALIADGAADRDELARYRRQLATWQTALQARVAGTQAPLERARIVHAYLHAELLQGGFGAECSRLETLCNSGRFNCLSSTIAFLTLARGAGVDVEGVAEPAHVYCQLTVSQPPLEVQTTDKGWFDERPQTERARTGPRRVVTDSDLLALVYYNQGVSRLAAGDFEHAARANAVALQLDPQLAQARQNLLAVYNNWAVARSAVGHFEESISLFEKGLQVAPQNLPLRNNLIALYRRWAQEHAEAGRWREAQRILDRGLEQFPGEAGLAAARDLTR